MIPTLPRSRRAATTTLAGAALVACLAGVTSPASAAVPSVVTCPQRTSPCTFTFSHASGPVTGTIDKTGTATTTLTWTVTARGVVVCHGTYRPADPARSFSCPAVPSGSAVFSTPGLPGSTRITLNA